MSSYQIRGGELQSTAGGFDPAGFVRAIIEMPRRVLARGLRRRAVQRRQERALEDIAELPAHVRDDLRHRGRASAETFAAFSHHERRSWLMHPLCD